MAAATLRHITSKLSNSTRGQGRISQFNTSRIVTGGYLAPLQAACITFPRGEPKKRPWPWPYEKWRYAFWGEGIDGTKKRMDENSRIIVVDGNIGTGKTEFAKELAKRLDFKYIPEATFDKYYEIHGADFDMRDIEFIMPESFKRYDLPTFYMDTVDPKGGKVGKIQVELYKSRFRQYCMAMFHMFCTGQGVVLDRSVFSDFVFAETLKKLGYMTREAYAYYRKLHDNSICELWRPHLCIYLDLPPAESMARIKERNIDYEVNSKILNEEYLQTIEDFYKKDFMADMSIGSEILQYDWSDPPDWDMIEEDIENLDLDPFSEHIYYHETKFHDWRVEFDREFCRYRRCLGCDEWKEGFLILAGYPYDAPEIAEGFTDMKALGEALHTYVPEVKYDKGWNPLVGDKWIIFSILRPFLGKTVPKIKTRWY